MAEHCVDVFISGAGPVGLLLAYQLDRQGLSFHVVDGDDKASPDHPMYGRACTLLPRTLEMFDQLDLFDSFAQPGVMAHGSVTYADGKRVHGRGWSTSVEITDSYFDFSMNLRLKYIEDIIRGRIEDSNGKVHAPVRLIDYELDESVSDEYKIRAICEDANGSSYTVRAKYIIGADGGHSTVRKIAGIPLQGTSSLEHWVRMDAVVKTNMPDHRIGYVAVESRSHGQVLWVALDHGATRIGFALTAEQYESMGPHLTEEQVISEAKQALKPFDLEVVKVDWHTTYTISQRLAERLCDRDRIFLAGDSAHTHSSGAAQGLNTGVHDAVTLAWRIAGALKGRFQPAVLGSYSPERHATAARLIAFDKQLSVLQSGHISEGDKEKGDIWLQLDRLNHEYKDFSTGLGISYEANLLNVAEPPLCITVLPGHRAPDVAVQKPGPKFPLRLFELTKNNGKFKVVVFMGAASEAKRNLREVAEKTGIREGAAGYDLVTIIAGYGTSPDEYMGFVTFGKAVWDLDHTAHRRYGITVESGAIVVIRPDGIVGTTTQVDGFEDVKRYFARILAT